MTKMEHMQALRSDPSVHYNCAQSVAIPFAKEMGVTEEKANELMLNFGGGMGCGLACGALTGALAAMGGMGLPQEKRLELIEAFREKHGCVNCGELTAGLEKGTPEMRALCDGFVAFCLDYLCREVGVE